jgi:hypothetical protein
MKKTLITGAAASPVQHPISRHLFGSDGQTKCGLPTEGENVTTTLGWVTCSKCYYVHKSQGVKMSQPTFTHRQIAEVFATQVSRISASAANEVNEYLRAVDDDRGQYLFTLRRLVAEMHTLIDSIRSVGDLIDNVTTREQFLAKSRYWLLRALRNSVDSTIAEIEAN